MTFRRLAWTLSVALPLLAAGGAAGQDLPEAEQTRRREALVDRLGAEEIDSPAVLAALRKVRRHVYIPPDQRVFAYQNRPLPIGEGQTISQPLVVALMTHLLELDDTSRVLEIGTGSGYQAAVLAELAGEVYSIEIVEPLGRHAAEVLAAEGYGDIHLRIGDGYLGWPEAAPFDGIIVTCAPDHVPEPLQEQLAEGGRLVIPVGETGRTQQLVVVTKQDGELVRREIVDVRFVPMTGPAVERDRTGAETAVPPDETAPEDSRDGAGAPN